MSAWTDQDWINEGAAVRVSLISFDRADSSVAQLNGVEVQRIQPDLSDGESRTEAVHLAVSLPENADIAFSGITKKGAFDLSGDKARAMLAAPAGPHGRYNAEVLFPWKNGDSIVGRDPDKWIISFGEMEESEAMLFPEPFSHVQNAVYSMRARSNSAMERRRWWQLGRRAPDLFAAIDRLPRFLVTPEVSKHRVFVWLSGKVVPDKNLVAIARDDDATFGVLQSRIHSVWALRVGTRLEDRPRYTSTTTFRSFAFPKGLTPNTHPSDYANDSRAQRIAAAAKRLHELRENWVNPPDLVERTPEVVSGYPERLIPKSPEAAKALKKRTLTNLYNDMPAWLQHAHQELDKAVAAAYGWEWPLPEDEILKRLFTLNQERCGLLKLEVRVGKRRGKSGKGKSS